MSVNVTVTEKENVELKVVSSSSDAVQLDLGNTQHNSLIGIQGGAAGQYYHLSLTEYSNLINTDNQALYVNITGAETITGLKTFLSGIQISANSEVINITGDFVSGNKKLFIDSESLIIGGGVELKTGDLNMGTNSITNVGNIDGRDVSADGSKLDGIETAATADQTAAEIRSLVESATDSNVFTDDDHSKLNAIEASADVTDTTNVVSALTAGLNITIAADGTVSSTDTNTQLSNEQVQDIVGAMLAGNSVSGITVTYQDSDGTIDFSVDSQTDNNFTDADHTKLDGIETAATADQTAAEIRALVESATDSNVFTDADHSKLDGIEAGATADQTAAEIRTLVESASDSNVFTDSDHTKLDGVEAGADVTPSWVPSSDPSYATETYVGTQVANLVDSAPNDLNTLNELAEALGDDENFATTVNNNIATKLPLTGGTMTGPINMGTNEITNVGNVDGRDVSADGSKLDGIETAATADQTAAEIRTLVESATDSNVFTDADHTKLNTSVSITGSQTISGIKTFDSGYKINAGGQDILITGDLDGSDRKLYIDAESLIVGENSVNSLYSAAILGSGNKIFGDYDVIAGGELNIVSGDNYSVIIGGRSNLIELGGLGYNTINGGTSHSIKRSTACLVDGGYDNDILGASNAVIVGGQSSNITSGTIAPDHSIILGGENNNIQDASNAIVVGGVNNFASGSFSTVMAGRGGRAIHEGSMVLADGKVGRSKTSFSEHGLTIDFASGVDVPTGNLVVAEDITMGGDTVATRTWVENRDLGQRFDSVLPSGVEETGVLFPTAFSAAPMVQSELQLPNGGERTYFIAVRDITTTGFFVEFSDNIGAGYVLQTRAIPNT